MNRYKGFAKGSTTFICVECGKRTRLTGAQPVDSRLCPVCCEIAEWDNALSDGHIDQKRYDLEMARLNRNVGMS